VFRTKLGLENLVNSEYNVCSSAVKSAGLDVWETLVASSPFPRSDGKFTEYGLGKSTFRDQEWGHLRDLRAMLPATEMDEDFADPEQKSQPVGWLFDDRLSPEVAPHSVSCRADSTDAFYPGSSA
jgi:hypothetical protein